MLGRVRAQQVRATVPHIQCCLERHRSRPLCSPTSHTSEDLLINKECALVLVRHILQVPG